MGLREFTEQKDVVTHEAAVYREFVVTITLEDGKVSVSDLTGVTLDDVGGISWGYEQRPWYETDHYLGAFADRVSGIPDRGRPWVGVWLPVESVVFIDRDQARGGGDREEVVELTGDDLPYHLRADAPPLAICDWCERQSWAESEVDQVDRMTQPNGRPCGGRLWGTTKPNLAQAMHYADEGLHVDGGHHKQWYLEEILKALGAPLPPDTEVDRGIPG